MKVLVTNVDMNGLCGRDLHPQPTDVGRVGTVVDAFVDADDASGFDPIVLFTVQMIGGGKLELAEHEVEVITESKFETLRWVEPDER